MLGVPASTGLSVAAAAVIAHEVGHALQDRERDPWMAVRQTIVPAVQIGSGIGPWLIIAGVIFQITGLVGTITALVITHLVITIPIIVWIMIGYFENVPMELEDAARIDGATTWQAFRHVALPLARPGIVVGGILAFIFSWNNFIFSVVLGGKASRTLPSAVYNSLTFEQISWGPLAAAALLVTLPVLLLTVLAQREIVAGLSAGGLKDG